MEQVKRVVAIPTENVIADLGPGCPITAVIPKTIFVGNITALEYDGEEVRATIDDNRVRFCLAAADCPEWLTDGQMVIVDAAEMMIYKA